MPIYYPTKRKQTTLVQKDVGKRGEKCTSKRKGCAILGKTVSKIVISLLARAGKGGASSANQKPEKE